METNHRFLTIEWVCRMFQATTQAIKWFFIVGSFFFKNQPIVQHGTTRVQSVLALLSGWEEVN